MSDINVPEQPLSTERPKLTLELADKIVHAYAAELQKNRHSPPAVLVTHAQAMLNALERYL